MDSEVEEKKSTSISFSFAKKKTEVRQLQSKDIGDKEKVTSKDETDYILSLERNKVKSVVPKEKPKELVIPLIVKNRWQNVQSHGHEEDGRTKRSLDNEEDKKSKRSKRDETPSGPADSLESEAVKEIMKDVSRYNEEWSSRDKEDLNMTIPLLMQNKVPEGYETDNKLDVSIRPEAATDANYEEVPIEQFGMAMLRGMGWKASEGIGSKMKRAVEPVEITVRPKGQGLGADRRPGDELSKKRKPKRKPGDPAAKEDEEPKGWAKGAPVIVTSGPHKNLYGLIEGVDEDNSRVVIKFALSGQAATLSQFAVQRVTQDDYKRYSRDLGKFSKGHDELRRKEEEKARDDSDSCRHRDQDDKSKSDRHDSHSKDRHKDKHRSDRHSDRDRAEEYDERDREQNGERKRRHKHHKHSKSERSSDRDEQESHSGRDRDRHREKEDHGRRREEREDKKSSKHRTDHDRHSSPSVGSEKTSYWLRRDLRVRLIDAAYKGGKYYNVKVRVVDVITEDTCTCQTDDGKFLQDIDQSMVETLIPRSDPAYVMVVVGKRKGQLGIVLKRDKSNCQADVQLLQDREKIVKMDYDIICEYAGNIQDEEDY